MIELPLEKISFNELSQFVQQKWPEGKSIDYKRDAYGNRDEDKKELLKDVSSFANTIGGDILIGVDEDKGFPIRIPGVALVDVEKEKLRLEGIIRQGLEPRIDFGIHHVTMPSGSFVLIIRVKESLLFPHRVVYQGKFGEFWGRSSAGKFSMDTNELRRAFTLSDSIYEQIRSFRQNRVNKIPREPPMPLKTHDLLILHLIPVESFRAKQPIDYTKIKTFRDRFPTVTIGGFDYRRNLDGHLFYSRDSVNHQCSSYTQLFRNGIIEAVLTNICGPSTDGKRLLNCHQYEFCLVEHYKPIQKYLEALKEVGIKPPLWLFMSLLDVKNSRILCSNRMPPQDGFIDRNDLLLPEMIIDNLDTDPVAFLKPMFDLVWNASGYEKSANFDESGKWIGN